MDNKVQVLDQTDNRQSLGKIVFFIALILFLASSILKTTTFPNIEILDRVTKLACYLLLAVKLILLDQYQVRQFILLFLFGIVAAISAFQSDYSNLLLITMLIISARDINFSEINQVYFVIGCIIIGLAVIASKTGLITNYVYYRGTIMRQSFGVVYPTDFAAHVFYLILSYCFLIKRRLKLFEVFIIGFIAFLINKYCDARLDVVLIILTVICYYVFLTPSFQKKIHKLVNGVSSLLPISLFSLAFALSYFYKATGFMALINQLLSGRLALGKRAFTMYPIKLFGQFIETHGFGGENGNNLAYAADRFLYFYIDSSYIFMLLRYGLIFTIIILLLLTVKTKKTKSMSYNLAIILVLSSAFVDQTLLNPAYNIFILSLFSIMPKQISYDKI